MIPILYRYNTTNFTNNGIGRLSDATSFIVTEERNGKYEAEFEYPITGKFYNQITEGSIVYTTHDDSGEKEPFIIYKRSAPINGIVKFNAHHISYNLNNVIIAPFTAGSCSEAMNYMSTNRINSGLGTFTYWTDKNTVANLELTVPKSAREILGGSEGSILDVYGGEYKWEHYTVRLYNRRGEDKDVTIRYGKNLTDLTYTKDISSNYNSAVAFWYKEDEGLVRTGVVYSTYMTPQRPITLDLTNEFENKPTTTQLSNKAKEYLSNNQPWIPKENLKVDFVALWQTEEYKDMAALQRVNLCDTVNVYYKALGVTAAQVKVIKTVYNVLLDRYDSMELGETKSTFAQSLRKEYTQLVQTAFENTEGMMDAAIDHATKLITGADGGNVVIRYTADGKPYEILIMDTADILTAQKVLRMNVNGIGFSSTGYNGTYRTAWTLDGNFVADFITTGTLNANLIKTGTLADTGNNTSFNLSTGALTMNKGSINIGNGTFQVTTGGVLTANSATIKGMITSGNYGSGNWARLNANGMLEGGKQSTRYGYIDYSATVRTIGTSEVYYGIQMQGGVLRINTTILSVENNSDTSVTTWRAKSGLQDFITRIDANSDGTITWYKNTFAFKNGIFIN